MWPNHFYCCEQQRKPTLDELREKVMKITESIKCINDSELSVEVTALAIKELQEKKTELIKLMHKMVDEL
jgi:hypothetical protein